MAQVLNYRIENASLVDQERLVEIDGESHTAIVKRAAIEAVPESGQGPTFTMSLPASALDEFAEGDAITVTVAKAADPEPAN